MKNENQLGIEHKKVEFGYTKHRLNHLKGS